MEIVLYYYMSSKQIDCDLLSRISWDSPGLALAVPFQDRDVSHLLKLCY